MSERQVQYTDGSWSREVEATDDLLDEATRLADNSPGVGVGPLLRALVERVQQAEAEAISLRSIVSHETQMREDAEARASQNMEYVRAWRERAERAETFADGRLNEARGKLDKVREVCDQANEGMPLVTFGGHVQSHRINVDDVLAILDGKTGD